ncbi:DUF1236 domain-containing protein [Bradyrhizobium sediminis]|uniref:DUF1236 domain-containing protein n=1 Tax=Bradyrhizobium sediminis TaxID=2840469 RepID=A0A975NSQ1_9BRAD|nr:DUF1236 domain-containing protein [Bradyrhizobium sediminis]QWG20587.1 DUF1236 domain-containing protein [Bradyrhizobium sediminis]
MTNRFLISVAAAALIAGTGFANAQGTGMSREGGVTTQQSAPSSERDSPSAVPMNRDAGESKHMKGAQSNEKMAPGGNKNQRAQDNMPGQKPKGMASEQDRTKDGIKGGKDMKAESREGRSGSMNADSKSHTTTQSQTAPSGPSTTTTGQAGAGAKLSTEQRTQITSVIREQRVAPVTKVNFSIVVGTKVPRSGVTFHPLPARVVTIYPQWRGYEFILVNEQIVVINPRTLEIVAILEA